MTKIGIHSWFMDGDKTGIGTYTYELIKNFLKMKKEVYLIHYKENNCNLYAKAEEIRISYAYLPSWLKYLIEPLKLRKYVFSLIHFPSHYYIQIPHYIFGNYKKIVTIHDLSPVLFRNTHNLKNSWLWSYSLKPIIKKINIIIADSCSTKRDVMKYYKIPEEKLKVIYLGFDKTLFNKRKINVKERSEFLKKYNLPDNFILYVGTLEKRKNVESLIKALNVLKKKGKKYTLVIVGKKGWKYRSIFELIDKYQLNDQIIFTGYVPREDLPLFYNLANVFVYPSLYEGFGLPPLEAMACGCPVITTNVSSLPEVVGDAGILINDPYDYITLAEKIDEVVQSETLRKKLIKKGLKRCKLFSWEKCAKETWEVYEEVLR